MSEVYELLYVASIVGTLGAVFCFLGWKLSRKVPPDCFYTKDTNCVKKASVSNVTSTEIKGRVLYEFDCTIEVDRNTYTSKQKSYDNPDKGFVMVCYSRRYPSMMVLSNSRDCSIAMIIFLSIGIGLLILLLFAIFATLFDAFV